MSRSTILGLVFGFALGLGFQAQHASADSEHWLDFAHHVTGELRDIQSKLDDIEKTCKKN
jgi:hypothetical protein